MTRHRIRCLAAVALLALGSFLAGCDTTFVREAARESLATFIVSIFSTAVDETVAPQD